MRKKYFRIASGWIIWKKNVLHIFCSVGIHHIDSKMAAMQIGKKYVISPSGEGSLACYSHIYCDMGHPFTKVINGNPWHSHRAFGSGAVNTCLYDLGLSRLGFEHQASLMKNNGVKYQSLLTCSISILKFIL